MASNAPSDDSADFARRMVGAASEKERREIFKAFRQYQRREAGRLGVLYPANPPNGKCNTAIIDGILLSNGAGLQPGKTYRYFICGPERVYVWTHTPNEYSALIARVDPDVKKARTVWKTSASILQIAVSFASAFEHIHACGYRWMYRFRPDINLDNQEFYREFDVIEANIGSIQNLWFLAELAPLIDLLLRDDTFFAAAQQYYSSITSHWFCLQCELGPPGNIHHPSHEPEAWERISVLPQLDNGLLQAYRAAETLVGKAGGDLPPKTDPIIIAVPPELAA